MASFSIGVFDVDSIANKVDVITSVLKLRHREQDHPQPWHMQYVSGLDPISSLGLKNYGSSPNRSAFRFITHGYFKIHLLLSVVEKIFPYSRHMSRSSNVNVLDIRRSSA